ncbi:hypothetical protein Niako_0639 [Niastella koreensis GR20-10]|uniref:Uncharacterized protein n=1 Tax=Niastella koreensis (strain DSM 17620 / KACC 11465 / NBRC 106392 / GR20-10) TaxID=700598 RepID=G8T971_NIAKG|nr:hypothetical protein [Niastella koreensis]AEV97024.1 hypothetical protein Niako_0639 [Niastella koreensis GR20-10]
MTRDELIELGKKIIAPDVSEEEGSGLMELFDAHVPHPVFKAREVNSKEKLLLNALKAQ